MITVRNTTSKCQPGRPFALAIFGHELSLFDRVRLAGAQADLGVRPWVRLQELPTPLGFLLSWWTFVPKCSLKRVIRHSGRLRHKDFLFSGCWFLSHGRGVRAFLG